MSSNRNILCIMCRMHLFNVQQQKRFVCHVQNAHLSSHCWLTVSWTNNWINEKVVGMTVKDWQGFVLKFLPLFSLSQRSWATITAVPLPSSAAQHSLDSDHRVAVSAPACCAWIKRNSRLWLSLHSWSPRTVWAARWSCLLHTFTNWAVLGAACFTLLWIGQSSASVVLNSFFSGRSLCDCSPQPLKELVAEYMDCFALSGSPPP